MIGDYEGKGEYKVNVLARGDSQKIKKTSPQYVKEITRVVTFEANWPIRNDLRRLEALADAFKNIADAASQDEYEAIVINQIQARLKWELCLCKLLELPTPVEDLDVGICSRVYIKKITDHIFTAVHLTEISIPEAD